MPNPGTSYTALANLSLPRKGRKSDDPNDLVTAGEQVVLTAEQAAPFINRTPPVLVKTSDYKGSGPVLLRPRDLSGRLRLPPANPPRGYDGPRRDPAGSSHVLVMQEIPEGAEPQPGDENHAVPAGESIVDAIDLPPSGHARTGALS